MKYFFRHDFGSLQKYSLVKTKSSKINKIDQNDQKWIDIHDKT